MVIETRNNHNAPNKPTDKKERKTQWKSTAHGVWEKVETEKNVDSNHASHWDNEGHGRWAKDVNSKREQSHEKNSNQSKEL